MKKKITYKSTGVVYGRFWGGGEGIGIARELEADTKKELLEKAKKGLNGMLDSGMGFEKLLGALLLIQKTTEIYIDNKLYRNHQYQQRFIGCLTQKQKNFCYEYL